MDNNPWALGARRQLTTALFAALVLSSGCAVETIAHQQPELEANRIINLLAKEGIEAQKIRDEESRDLAFNVTVMKEDKEPALDVLIRFNLPKKPAVDTEDMFKEGGMIPTATQEEAKRAVGVRGDIVNALRKIRGVVDASAVVAFPKDDPLRDVDQEVPKPKASVIIHYLPDEKGRPPITPEGLQNYVAAVHSDLEAASVTVLMLPAVDVTPQAAGPDGSPDGTAPMLSANACEKERIIGIDVCSQAKKRFYNTLWGSVMVAFVLSALVVISVLRAMSYRRDLTRLTAQVQQLRK